MEQGTALITGSSKGLGRELALKFAEKGYNLIIHGRNLEDLEATSKYITNEIGKGCITVQGDLRDSATLEKLYNSAKNSNLAVLINNAGIYTNNEFMEMSEEEIKSILEVNLVAPILLTHKIYPILKESKSGLIININSIAAKAPNSREALYCASKAGLMGFSNSFKYSARGDGVNILDVYLGAMSTQMTAGRKDPLTCIDPKIAAEAIFDASLDRSTLFQTEITLLKKYGKN